MITTKIFIRTDQLNVPIALFAVEGESESRAYQFSVVDPSGTLLDFSSSVVSFYIEKPDGNLVMLPCVISGTTATVTLTLQSAAVPGQAPCWLQIIQSDSSELRIDNMTLFIQACDLTEATESSPEFTALQEALGDVATFNAHLTNYNNPHQTTAEQVGARPADWLPTPEDIGAVPTSRTVNTKPLSADITLSAGDVGARPDTWLPTLADLGLTISQGEWTPSLFAYAGTTDPTVSYNSQKGYYYRIGNLVHIIFSITGNITKLGNGNAGIKGLPSELLPQMASPVTLGRCFFLVGTDPTVSFTANIDGSTGEIQIRNAGGRTRQNFVLSSTDSFEVLGSATYIAGS